MMELPCAAAEGRICLVTPEHLSMSIPVYLMKAEVHIQCLPHLIFTLVTFFSTRHKSPLDKETSVE